MKQASVIELAHDVLIPQLNRERDAQIVFDAWAKGDHVKAYKPREASTEYEGLREKAITPLIGLVIRILAQSIEMRDYIPGIESTKDDLMDVWRRNAMGMRQKRLYRAVFRGGVAYSTLLPGDPVPVSKIYSAKNALAVYQDPEADHWPEFGIIRETASNKKSHFLVIDGDAVYRIEGGHDGEDLKYIEEQAHDVGLPPIVRFTGEMDDEGSAEGEVERLIPIQGSIDQAKFDLLMTQTFASWKIRVLTGMQKPGTQEEAQQQKLVLERDRLLILEGEQSKAFTLDGTDLEGYIKAGTASKQDLASVAQIAQKAIVGSQSNTSDGAEAQAAEEWSTQRKIKDYEESFAASWGQWFRLAGLEQGIANAWDDYAGVCDWRDSTIRSMSQMADALGKIASQLGVPKQELWDLIPDISPDQVRRWKEVLANDPYRQMLEGLGDDDPFADG
ncbi:phage portal protein [Pseudoclavibacter endophyticus]|uniref:Phage portal protein n=1 Tax=Pseudoclavibacter endophyticus TaxID=1778590 RepID=A0A6H9WIR8_9MICO|nr:phage portal protein [Pseudoclavibacter endophyticus]KAB1648417.1 phage portal protein [Pseudoclavibacter endophyticus]